MEAQCSGCGKDIYIFAGDPCMDCVKARHRAVVTGKCSCPKRLRRESAPIVAYRINGRAGRTFTKCSRCLGHVRQLA